MNTKNIRAIMIDIDGVLIRGNAAIAGAVEAVKQLKDKYRCIFVTNVSRMSTTGIVAKLKELGFDLSEKEVFTAVAATVSYLKSRDIQKIFLLCEGAADQDFRAAGIDISEDGDAVVIGMDRAVTYEKLDKAYQLVKKGKELIAMNADKTVPLGREISLAAGFFVAGMEYSSGKKATVIGKPSATFFSEALEKLGARREETVMIGDSITSDIVGAKGAGISAILVRTGNYNEADVRSVTIKPDMTIDSIMSLPKVLA